MSQRKPDVLVRLRRDVPKLGREGKPTCHSKPDSKFSVLLPLTAPYIKPLRSGDVVFVRRELSPNLFLFLDSYYSKVSHSAIFPKTAGRARCDMLPQRVADYVPPKMFPRSSWRDKKAAEEGLASLKKENEAEAVAGTNLAAQ